jgi:hypothetical protein
MELDMTENKPSAPAPKSTRGQALSTIRLPKAPEMTPEQKREADYERRRIARKLRKTTGEIMMDRKYSFWMWVYRWEIPPTSTELRFRQHFLPNGYGEEPRETDPPEVHSEDDVTLLLQDISLPAVVREGGRRLLRQFLKDGWGFIRPTDKGYQTLGHRYRMKLVQRHLRAKRRKGYED